MKIQKFLHSCLLLEKKGKRILIDPGSFSFIEGKIKPEDIGKVDAIFITHKHLDHFDPPILKKFVSFGQTPIFTIEDIGNLLASDGLAYERIKPGSELNVEGFSVKVFDAPHGSLPFAVPDNVAFMVDGLLHPGDSLKPQQIEACDILALPVAGPWVTLNDAVALVDALKPKKVIPIHDVFIKDFMLDRMYEVMIKPLMDTRKVEFLPLRLGTLVK